MSPPTIDTTCELIAEQLQVLTRENHIPILLVSPQTRPGLRQITSANLPQLHILSYNEITRDIRIESHGIVQEMTEKPTNR
jgi:flagellar biosynthesis protein FlhA